MVRSSSFIPPPPKKKYTYTSRTRHGVGAQHHPFPLHAHVKQTLESFPGDTGRVVGHLGGHGGAAGLCVLVVWEGGRVECDDGCGGTPLQLTNTTTHPPIHTQSMEHTDLGGGLEEGVVVGPQVLVKRPRRRLVRQERRVGGLAFVVFVLFGCLGVWFKKGCGCEWECVYILRVCIYIPLRPPSPISPDPPIPFHIYTHLARGPERRGRRGRRRPRTARRALGCCHGYCCFG